MLLTRCQAGKAGADKPPWQEVCFLMSCFALSSSPSARLSHQATSRATDTWISKHWYEYVSPARTAVSGWPFVQVRDYFPSLASRMIMHSASATAIPLYLLLSYRIGQRFWSLTCIVRTPAMSPRGQCDGKICVPLSWDNNCHMPRETRQNDGVQWECEA